MDVGRRQFIKKIGVILTTTAMIYYCPHAFSLTRSAQEEKYYLLFSKTSALLTGNTHLAPDLTELYFNKLYEQKNNKAFIALLDLVQDHSTDDSALVDKFGNELRHNTIVGKEISKIIDMWYFGKFDNQTVSAKAYQNSLAWRAYHTTPPGVSNGTHWDSQPNVSV